ncbi:thioredoxin fold domain-containing protein [Poseidonibacter ostreae]|uniref:Thioredoxin fold domain-containing protein n=1 Tax=Poseidonibacter ostreae TaxID=2654171 RepID=A0A6L4WWK1_9BACT|nr:thioredoxin fold domain-containing protein [Poseidonibacter ostreae]KAB7891261.1 thioredoxin fold domain-containing protein [Poseidonibacter ostreae]
MKKRNKILLSLVALASLANADFLSQEEVKNFDKAGFFDKVNGKVTRVFDSGSMYIVDVQQKEINDTVYVTKDKKVMFSGVAIDMNKGQKINLPVDISIAKGKESFSIGNGKNEISIFTDAQCPYCQAFVKYIPEIIEKTDTKINVFHYPLQMHSKARALAQYQTSLVGKMNPVDIIKIDEHDRGFRESNMTSEFIEKANKEIDEQIAIGNKLGIKGTPYILDSKGNVLDWQVYFSKLGIKIGR